MTSAGSVSDAYTGRTVLITGAAGVVGSALLRQLAAYPCRIICQYHNQLPWLPESGSQAEMVSVRGDLGDDRFWTDLLPGVDLVFHLAAQTSATRANKCPTEDLVLNLMPIASFLETTREMKQKPGLVMAGTVTQVGITLEWPVNEQVQDRPVTIYDIDKLAAEHYVRCYGEQLNGKGATLRLSNVYGPGPKSSRDDRGITNRMVSLAMQGQPLTVYGAGDQVRDYIFIDDVATAFVRAGAHLEAINGQHFVIGNGQGHTIREMVTTVRDVVAEITGQRVEVRTIPAPEGLLAIESRHFVADIGAFCEVTDWHPAWSLEQGLRETVHHYQTIGLS